MPSTMSGYGGHRTTSYSYHGQRRMMKAGGDYPRRGEGHGYSEGTWYGDSRPGRYKQEWRGSGGAGHVDDHGQYGSQEAKEDGSNRNLHQKSTQYRDEIPRYGRHDDGGRGRKDRRGGFRHHERWDRHQTPGVRRGQQERHSQGEQYLPGEMNNQGGQLDSGERHCLGEQQERGVSHGGHQDIGGRYRQSELMGRGGRYGHLKHVGRGGRNGQWVQEGRGGRHRYEVNGRNTWHSDQQYGASQQYRRSLQEIGTVDDGEWASVFKLTNVPTSVGVEKFRSILQQREVGGFNITRFEVGEVIVKFRTDVQVVVEKLKGLRIDDCIIKKEAIYHKSKPVSPQVTDNVKYHVGEVLSKVPTEDLAENVGHIEFNDNQEANGGGGRDVNDKGKKQDEEVGPQDDHIHDWSTEADRDQEQDRSVRIDKTSKHNNWTEKAGRKKDYGGLIEGKEETESQNRIESNSAKKKNKKKRDNWATFKFSNLPNTVTILQLREALRDHKISGKFYIKKLGRGFGFVSIQNGLQMKTWKDFKMGDQIIKIELVETASNAHQETKSNSLEPSLPKPEETDLNVIGVINVPPIRVKVPEHVTEAVMRDITGLTSFVPEFCEVRQGEVALVFIVGPEVIERIKTFAKSCIEDTILGKDGSVEVSSKKDPTCVVEQSETGVQNVVVTNNQETNGSKMETPKDVDDVPSPKSQTEVLIPVDAVFASTDVREKVKVIGSLGDSLTPSTPSKAPEGQLKKKKKKGRSNTATVLKD